MTEAASRRRPPALGQITAIVLFLAVYAGTLVVLFGPRDLIGAQPGSMFLSAD